MSIFSKKNLMSLLYKLFFFFSQKQPPTPKYWSSYATIYVRIGDENVLVFDVAETAEKKKKIAKYK